MKTSMIAKKMLLTLIVAVLSLNAYAVNRKDLEKEAFWSIQKILTDAYGPVILTSFRIHTEHDKTKQGTAIFLYQGKEFQKEVIVTITKETWKDYNYECGIVWNHDNIQVLRVDAPLLLAGMINNNKEWKGMRLINYSVSADKNIRYKVSLDGETAIITVQVRDNPNNDGFNIKVLSVE